MSYESIARKAAQADKLSVARRSQLVPESQSEGILGRLKKDVESFRSPEGKAALMKAFENTPMPMSPGGFMLNEGPMLAKEMEKFATQKPPNISMHPSNRLKTFIEQATNRFSRKVKVLNPIEALQDYESSLNKIAPTNEHRKFWVAQQLMQRVFNREATEVEINWLKRNGFKVPE